LLGDIPLLGHLFRATSNTKTKRNLLVFLRPTLLKDSASTAELSQRHYDNIRTLQLSVSKSGKVTRLPENIEAVYQGYKPRQTEASQAAPAPAQN